MATTRQFCTFHLEQHMFGIDVLDVQEIIRQQHVTRVPLASPVICGLINLRGQIVSILDLRLRLGLPMRSHDKPSINVVVRTPTGAIGLLVDEVGDMMLFPENSFEPPPETLRGPVRSLMHGVYKLKSQLLLVLDTAKTVDISTSLVAQ
jgi:purine-binding chemotaxis protein CheW